MPMNTDNSLTQFNATIGKWIGYLDNYSLETLCRRPQTGAWSLGQVYVHIIEDTWFFVEQIKACLQLNDANSEKEMHKNAKAMFEKNAFPDMALENPNNDPDLRQPQSKDELLQGLIAIKQEVNQLAASAVFQHSTGKTQHPGLLFFNATEWLQFAEMHMRHHLRQKKRIDDILFQN